MGLLYVFPVSKEETDFVLQDGDKTVLKSYGLPYIFWIYALCVVAVVAVMFFAVKEPVLKLVSLGDETDRTLGYGLLSLIGISPLVIFGFFFYEKRIISSGDKLTMEYRIFGIKVFSETFTFKPEDLEVDGFIDSPNVARMKNKPDELGFQNKGYFVLWLRRETGKRILIDRHSRKVDLDKLRTLILR